MGVLEAELPADPNMKGYRAHSRRKREVWCRHGVY